MSEQEIFSHYFDTVPPDAIKIQRTYRDSPDCLLHLCTFGTNQYVIIEIDYISSDMPYLVKVAEKVFTVDILGWCVLNQHKKEAHTVLLSPNIDGYDPDGTNEVNYNNYRFTILRPSVGYMLHAILKVG